MAKQVMQTTFLIEFFARSFNRAAWLILFQSRKSQAIEDRGNPARVLVWLRRLDPRKRYTRHKRLKFGQPAPRLIHPAKPGFTASAAAGRGGRAVRHAATLT
jgi:hypothetical protein